MTEENKAMGSIFDDESTVPESEWWAMETPGQRIEGVLVLEPYDKDFGFGPNRVYVIETPDGKEINVGLKHTTHARAVKQLRGAQPGDILGFEYVGEVDTGKGNPAKSIKVRIRRMGGVEGQVKAAGL